MMNMKSAFVRSLMALAAAVPASHLVEEASAEAAPQTSTTPTQTPAASVPTTDAVEFSSSLLAKLDGVRPDDPFVFGEVWPRFDFTQVQNAMGAQVASSLSPVQAFERVNKLT